MHSTLSFPSRRLLLGVSAAAALLPWRDAMAASAASTGDWFATIRQHHRLVESSLEQLVAAKDWQAAVTQARNVDQLINAHSFAEEVVIYPAMARAGMEPEMNKFYMAEAHVKVLKSRLELATRMQQQGSDWKEAARAVQEALVPHAHDEETDEFPKLRDKLSPQENQQLTQLYTLHFSSVIPPVRR